MGKKANKTHQHTESYERIIYHNHVESTPGMQSCPDIWDSVKVTYGTNRVKTQTAWSFSTNAEDWPGAPSTPGVEVASQEKGHRQPPANIMLNGEGGVASAWIRTVHQGVTQSAATRRGGGDPRGLDPHTSQQPFLTEGAAVWSSGPSSSGDAEFSPAFLCSPEAHRTGKTAQF